MKSWVLGTTVTLAWLMAALTHAVGGGGSGGGGLVSSVSAFSTMGKAKQGAFVVVANHNRPGGGGGGGGGCSSFTTTTTTKTTTCRGGGGGMAAPFHPSRRRHGSASLSISRFPSSRLQSSLVEDFLSKTTRAARESQNDAFLQQMQERVKRINDWEPKVEELSDEELRQKTAEFRRRLANDGEDINGPLLEEAFAVVREAAWRVLELRHYDVQLLGGLVLHHGRLAEMATGEGKTLVATLPSYVNALLPESCSIVVTVNDYLARRDMEKMGQVHRFLGLSVGLIQSNDMTEEQRRKAYQSNVIYVTNAELGFDYLRDHLALSPAQTVLPSSFSSRGNDNDDKTTTWNAFCIVDEADSVLVDEARTPLIIAKQVPSPSNKFDLANRLAGDLQLQRHYTVDYKNKNVKLTAEGYSACEKALGLTSIFELAPDGTGAWAPYILNALKAQTLFQKDVDYAVLFQDNKDNEKKATGIGIIDSFTGRVLDGRRWSDGLHQSLEAKEGIAVSSQSQVTAKITYQALFRLFTRLSGMTGTAMADAEELEATYGLKVTPVPTALPVARRDYPDVTYKTRQAANDALVKEIAAVQAEGRPCLVGTTSIVQSNVLVEALAQRGITAQLLNALPANAARESEIIAQAGRARVVTVATNMAGRGTDILLGGCPATMARLKARAQLVKEMEEDLLFLTEKEKEALPPSPPEEYYPEPLTAELQTQLQEAALAVKLEAMDNDNNKKNEMTALQLDQLLTLAVDTTESEEDPPHVISLRRAVQAVEAFYRPILAQEKEQVQARGGLYVMGTNRHESSRIDLQLRGRAGRQGDPGSSRFFLSFQDDMFVLFGGDGLQKILQTFRVAEDMPVESAQVTQALNRVQETVELKFREVRAQMLQFDNVLNAQRLVIWKQRQEVLFGTTEETMKLLAQYHEETIRDLVSAQVVPSSSSSSSSFEKGKTVTNVDKVLEKMGQFFPLVRPVLREKDLEGLNPNAVMTFLSIAVEEVFAKKTKEMEQEAQAAGRAPHAMARLANYLTLVSMDNAWSNHLQNMENLKESVNLRTFTNNKLDPSAEYAKEALELFQGLQDGMRLDSVYSLWQNIASATKSVGLES